MRKEKNRRVLLSVLLAFCLTLAACGQGADSDTSDTAGGGAPALETGTDEAGTDKAGEAVIDVEALRAQMGFYVDGTTLYDANGNPFIMRGINHAHTWYSDKLFLALDGIAATGSNCIRIVLSDGEQWSETSAETVKNIISLCKERNMIVILEVHDATGYKDKESLLAAAQYFVDIKDVLIGEEDYCIINIANEWQGNSESKIWKEAYTEAIPMLREAGLAHTILVDSSGWGQYGRCIGDAGLAVFESDPLGNVMFAVHMYGTAGGTEEKIRQNLDYALEQNLCVCVGEFGYTHSDGDVEEAYLMEYCVENGIGYIAWSWKGNSGGVEYLDLAISWDGSELSEEWGEVVINGENGIKETSQICTVFTE
ncbi:MAG: glycoside hydrolase family 5 protein [Lachnospiraceae bacterium]|nr:glycoside hydrolase family 5 protein [Lachnospiraceae bacterium]